jgi:hypothetical protein
MANPTETIDALLAHYLTLLDEYTTLRASLNTLQAGVYQSLARANFSAERGVRHYGQDYYDERTQASRRVHITLGSSSSSSSGSSNSPAGSKGPCATDAREGGGEAQDDTSSPVFSVAVYPPPPPQPKNQDENEKEVGSDEKHQPNTPPPTTQEHDSPPSPKEKTTTTTNNNPLRWFGILTPLPLRQAQAQAITAAEELIPRLASVSAEMAGVELAVRRARKRRGKLEKAAERAAGGEKGVVGEEKGVGEEKKVSEEGGETKKKVVELYEEMEMGSVVYTV